MAIKKILLVDDESSVLKALERVLGVKPDSHFDITSTVDSLEAAKTVESGERFDLLVTDVRMKKLDGLGLIERVKAEQPDIPVIAISAYLNEDVISQLKSRGCAHFIRKPFRMQEVFQGIDLALGE